jgi:single-strand DNA-binding protein
MNLNKTFLIGRVTKDPEVLSTQSGKKVVKMSLATNQFMGKGKEDKTTFHNLVAWSSIADVAEKYITKGQEIMIEGHIDNRTYKKKDGSNGYISEVVVEKLQLGSKPGSDKQTKQDKQEEVDDSLPVINEDDEIDIKDIPF